MNKISINLDLYEGKGLELSKRSDIKMPLCDWQPDKASQYSADKGLTNAVNVSISLGQPLLITGEPGTGKTQLAYSIAHELELPGPFVFNTKTTSIARDLFYEYDALQHFQDSHRPDYKLNKQQYVQYNALGIAILLASSKEDIKKIDTESLKYIQENINNIPSEKLKNISKNIMSNEPTRSVVLIDEIDKAPRDLPNDLLNEVLEMAFTIKETRIKHEASHEYRPVMIITSNSEKNLPEPFLRRCVFYHIDFPDTEKLKEIVHNHLSEIRYLDQAVEHFESIRKKRLKKKPATAEFIPWITALQSLIKDKELDFKNLSEEQIDKIKISYSILAKSKEDFDLIEKELKKEN